MATPLETPRTAMNPADSEARNPMAVASLLSYIFTWFGNTEGVRAAIGERVFILSSKQYEDLLKIDVCQKLEEKFESQWRALPGFIQALRKRDEARKEWFLEDCDNIPQEIHSEYTSPAKHVRDACPLSPAPIRAQSAFAYTRCGRLHAPRWPAAGRTHAARVASGMLPSGREHVASSAKLT